MIDSMGSNYAENSAAKRAAQYTSQAMARIIKIRFGVFPAAGSADLFPLMASVVRIVNPRSIAIKTAGPNKWYRTDAVKSP